MFAFAAIGLGIGYTIYGFVYGPLVPQGPIGPPGGTGATGATGPTGATGMKGNRGLTGARGATGMVGPPGPPGPQGGPGRSCCNTTSGVPCAAKACDGPTGPQGNQGFEGTTGITGPTGATGGIRCWDFTGVALVCNLTLFDVNNDGQCDVNDCVGTVCDPSRNVTLCRGPVGLVGPVGRQGAVGPTGTASSITGPTGATGYACWDRNRNGVFDIASEDINGDLIASAADCRGAGGGSLGQGPNGDNGRNGFDGPKGPTGFSPRGVNGSTGTTGDTGPTGAIGATGPNGATGVTGPIGATGTPRGYPCYDNNTNGICDPSEDTDGTSPNGCTLADCVSPPQQKPGDFVYTFTTAFSTFAAGATYQNNFQTVDNYYVEYIDNNIQKVRVVYNIPIVILNKYKYSTATLYGNVDDGVSSAACLQTVNCDGASGWPPTYLVQVGTYCDVHTSVPMVAYFAGFEVMFPSNLIAPLTNFIVSFNPAPYNQTLISSGDTTPVSFNFVMTISCEMYLANWPWFDPRFPA